MTPLTSSCDPWRKTLPFISVEWASRTITDESRNMINILLLFTLINFFLLVYLGRQIPMADSLE